MLPTFGPDDRVVLQFSGGKDSLACLWLARPQWDRITVMWVNTGAAYPDTVAFMREIRAMVPHFMEVRSDQPDYLRTVGWPVDVLPLRHSELGRAYQGPSGLNLVAYFACCRHNIWAPLAKAVEALGANVVIRGQKASDKRKGPYRSGYEENGVRYLLPIEGWSDEGVMAYLEREGAPIPAYYRRGEGSSHDCWDCTAYVDENVQRIGNLAPEARALVRERLALIGKAVLADTEHLTAAVAATMKE